MHGETVKLTVPALDKEHIHIFYNKNIFLLFTVVTRTLVGAVDVPVKMHMPV